MKTYTKYIGPGPHEIWQTDFFPAEEVYDEPAAAYGLGLDMSPMDEARLPGLGA